MTYGKKLQPGDRWMVGRRWVEWDGEKVVGRCGGWFTKDHFYLWAKGHAYPQILEEERRGARNNLSAEAECIAQQIICEGLLP